MSAALKSEAVISYPRASASASVKKNRLTVLTSNRQKRATAPLRLLTRRRYPLWLKLMILGQWASLGMAVITILGALGAYSLTVNTNRKLTVATTTLEHLQEQQQQLTAANAMFKNHLAETALTTLQGNTLHPKDVIFLEVGEAQATASESTPIPTESASPEKRVFPQGY